MDLVEENGLKVLIQIMCESLPYWFERKYPDTRYMDANGRYVEFLLGQLNRLEEHLDYASLFTILFIVSSRS